VLTRRRCGGARSEGRNLSANANAGSPRLTGCKNFSRARRVAYGLIEASLGLHAPCYAKFAKSAGRVAIRAHHIRVRAPETPPENRANSFPCWLAA